MREDEKSKLLWEGNRTIVLLGGVIIHIWTMILAYQYSGLFATVLSFLFPVVSQIYWMYMTILEQGILSNRYVMFILLWILFNFGSAFYKTCIKPSY